MLLLLYSYVVPGCNIRPPELLPELLYLVITIHSRAVRHGPSKRHGIAVNPCLEKGRSQDATNKGTENEFGLLGKIVDKGTAGADRLAST